MEKFSHQVLIPPHMWRQQSFMCINMFYFGAAFFDLFFLQCQFLIKVSKKKKKINIGLLNKFENLLYFYININLNFLLNLSWLK